MEGVTPPTFAEAVSYSIPCRYFSSLSVLVCLVTKSLHNDNSVSCMPLVKGHALCAESNLLTSMLIQIESLRFATQFTTTTLRGLELSAAGLCCRSLFS